MSPSQQSTTFRTANPPLDGFRRALDVLIAHAPGTGAEIKHELLDAIGAYDQLGPVKYISRSEARLANHLMLMSLDALNNAAIKADRRDTPQSSGYLVESISPRFDVVSEPHAAGQPATAECVEHMTRMARRANRSREERNLTFQERLAKLLPEPPALTMLEPSLESGLQPAAVARPFVSPSDQ